MDVVVSVLGTGILSGSWARYTLENGTSLCATTPIAPILAQIAMNEPMVPDKPPYLVLVVPHSLVIEDLVWDVLEGYEGEIDVGRLSRELDRLCKRIIKAFVENDGSAILNWEDKELNASLKERLLSIFKAYIPYAWRDMEACRIKLALVQAIGSFPLLQEEDTTASEKTFTHLTFRGSVLDPFVKVYVALKEIARGSDGEGMTIHFDVSSGMNIVTISALLGARAFVMMHDAELKIYNTDPFKKEITDECGRERYKKKDGEEEISGTRIPLSVTSVDELMLTFRLIEDILSILGRGWWTLDPDEIEKISEEVRGELSSLYSESEDPDVDEVVEKVRKLLITLRRASCGLSETLVPYVHIGLKDLDELKGAIYRKGGPYERLREALNREVWGISSRSKSCEVQLSPNGTVLHYTRMTGPTFVLLDAVAYLLSKFYSKQGFSGKEFGFEARGPFDSAVLGSRGEVASSFLAGLMIFYFREGMYTNLAFILKELKFNEEETRDFYDLIKGGAIIPDDSKYNNMIDLVRRKFETYVENKFLGKKGSSRKENSNKGEKGSGIGLSEFITRRESCLMRSLKSTASGSPHNREDLNLFRLYYISKALSDLKRNLNTDEDRKLLDSIWDVEVKLSPSSGARLEILLRELLSNFMGESNCQNFASLVGDKLRNVGELIQIHISSGDKYKKLTKLVNWKRFDTFLKALVIRWNENAPEMVGKSDIIALLRNLIAHIGLTNFTVTDIVLVPERTGDGSDQGRAEVVIFYDEAMFRKLEHLSEIGDQGSLCDVR